MTTITGIRIATDTDETVSVVQLDATNLLAALDESIGCDFIETLELPDGIDAIFDEEGKLTGAQLNRTATAVVRGAGVQLLSWDYLAGAVVFLGYNDEGEHVSLTEAQRETILRAIVLARI